MKESVTYQAIVREGELRALKAMLLLQGKKKFGPPLPAIQASIQATEDVERLEGWVERLLEVDSWEELLA